MGDAPPPPYSLRDPNARAPAPPSYPPPQHITAFNAFVPPLAAGLPVRLPSGQASVPIRSASSWSPASPPQTTTVIPQARDNGVASENGQRELQKTGFVSAAPYFELRAPVQPRPSNVIYHHVSIGPDVGPENLPFPHPAVKWTRREVDNQDWMTFLNHMFPSHGVENDTKGSHNFEADAELETAGHRLNNCRSRDQSRPLLGKRPGPSAIGQYSETECPRRTRIEAVTAQWNEGFFGPRGLEVLVDINNLTPPVILETKPRRVSGKMLQKKSPPELEEGLLHKAVADKKKSHVKLLLDRGGEDMEALNKKGETVLYRAVSRGDKDIVQMLLDNGANPLARPEGSNAPLHVAVQNDRKTILKMLLEKSRLGIEELNLKDETPLYVACRKRYSSCIEVLLENSANPNARPVGQESMLNMTVTGDYKKIAKLLLQRGVDVEERNKNGETPLYRATSRGHTSMVKLLLDHGASAAARTDKGEAPLSCAASRGDKSIVLLLLAQKDIDIEVEDEKGRTPLYTSITRGDTSISDQLLRKGADPRSSPLGEEKTLALVVGRGNTSLTSLLLQRGAHVEEKNRSGESPLWVAVSRDDTSIVSLLLGKGADPNTLNTAGESALQRAVSRCSTGIVSLLLGKGADPNLKVITGEAPLWQAVYRNNTGIVSILLVHGADVNTTNSSGESVLQRTIYTSNTSIVSLLLSRGADPRTKCINGETMLEYATKKGDKTNIRLLQSYAPPPPPEKDKM